MKIYSKDGMNIMAEPGSALARRLECDGFTCPRATARCNSGWVRDIKLARRVAQAVAARDAAYKAAATHDHVAIKTTPADH